jgi:hypothetical protein
MRTDGHGYSNSLLLNGATKRLVVFAVYGICSLTHYLGDVLSYLGEERLVWMMDGR